MGPLYYMNGSDKSLSDVPKIFNFDKKKSLLSQYCIAMNTSKQVCEIQSKMS